MGKFVKSTYRPTTISGKDNALSNIIMYFATEEIKNPNTNINGIVGTISQWGKSGLDSGCPISDTQNVVLSDDDVTDVLVNSGLPGETKEEISRLFVTQTLLDVIIQGHNNTYTEEQSPERGASRIDNYLKNGDASEITRQLNSRAYLELLGKNNITKFLDKTGYESVQAYFEGGEKVKK